MRDFWKENGKWITYLIFFVVVIAAVILMRFWFVGGEFNECFWARDVGTCLVMRGK